jgi:DNA-3-methyladenine glycosylase II
MTFRLARSSEVAGGSVIADMAQSLLRLSAKEKGYFPVTEHGRVTRPGLGAPRGDIWEQKTGAARMVGRIIRTEACVAEGAAWLAEHEPRFAHALRLTGPLPLRLRNDGFAALFNAIVSQQVSVAAARAIWNRLEEAGLTDPETVAAADEETLRVPGLSRQKIRYAKALATAGIDFDALRIAPNDDVVATLVVVPGIGKWTAEIYAMFSLGRADIFAPGDLALQESARVLFDLDARPKEAAFRKMAEAWAPWRSVAAVMLWAYYRVEKDREGIL